MNSLTIIALITTAGMVIPCIVISLLSLEGIRQTKKRTYTAIIIICISTCVFFLNVLNAHIGQKQEPSKITVQDESVMVEVQNAYYENNDLFIRTKDSKIVSIPNNILVLTPTITVKKLLVRKEWNFIFPFYLESIEYEYLSQ